MEKLDGWMEWLAKAGLAGGLLAILALGQAGVWVWGSQLEEVKAERDEWRAIALKAAKVVEQSAFRPTASQVDVVGEIREQIRGLEARDTP